MTRAEASGPARNLPAGLPPCRLAAENVMVAVPDLVYYVLYLLPSHCLEPPFLLSLSTPLVVSSCIYSKKQKKKKRVDRVIRLAAGCINITPNYTLFQPPFPPSRWLPWRAAAPHRFRSPPPPAPPRRPPSVAEPRSASTAARRRAAGPNTWRRHGSWRGSWPPTTSGWVSHGLLRPPSFSPAHPPPLSRGPLFCSEE